MQFKKSFSSNLQNLHVKKTMVMAPPPELSHHTSLHQDSLSAQQSPLVHRHCRSTLQPPTSGDKENKPFNRQIGQCLSDSRHKSVQRNSNSPLLTFHSIRQQMSESQQQNQPSQRKAFASIPQNNPPLIHTRSNSEHTQNMKQKGFSSINKDKKSNVRLGSMVFSQMPRKSSKERRGPLRESKSYERLTMNMNDSEYLKCMNNDGHPAKYKVADSQTQHEDILYYCFNCAIPLVKQGFTIEQLTFQDRKRLSNYSRPQTSRVSHNNNKMKLGEQIKCKIIPKINKLKVSKDQFNRLVSTNTENIDYYYQSIMKHIEQQREKDQKDYGRIVKNQRQKPEQYQQQLSSALGTIDYLLKHPQGLCQQALQDVEEIVNQNESQYPLKQSVEPREGFQTKIEHFISMFDQHFKLNIEPETQSMFNSRNRRNTFDIELLQKKDHMRFSFQSALQESKRNQNRINTRGLYEMRPLQEQNQSEYEQSIQEHAERQDAFRNLFPEENQEWNEELDRHKASPVFKQF